VAAAAEALAIGEALAGAGRRHACSGCEVATFGDFTLRLSRMQDAMAGRIERSPLSSPIFVRNLQLCILL